MKQSVNWHKHWERKNPGFHEGTVNIYLQQYLDRFSLQPGDTIFMPLCGKAVDILWLSQQGYRVIGVELSKVAIDSFFAESGITPEIQNSGKFTLYQAQNIHLYLGDYLDLLPAQLRDCCLVYDRASIVAIESYNRQSYVNHMFKLVDESTPMLLVTLEYDQEQMQGPPFSVPVSEIRQLFQPRYHIELLETREQIHERPKWRENGLESLCESALLLNPK